MTRRPVVLVEFSPSGGLFQFGYQLGEALAQRTAPVELWTGPEPEMASATADFTVRSVLPTWHPADTEVRSRALRKVRRPLRAAQLVLAWCVLGVRLLAARPQAVLFSQWRFTFEPWFVVAFTRLLPRTTFGIVAHEPFPRSDAKDTSTVKSGRLLQRSFAAAWRRLDIAFVLGEQTRALVQQHWQPRCEVVVIPHGDEGALRDAGPTTDERSAVDTDPVALFFGTWSKYKGLDVLLTAFGLVRQQLPAARLVLAGAVGADVDPDQLLVRAREIGNVDAFPTYIESNRVAELVTAARVVVTPYVRASQSGVVHLAYTFGRPVVATDVGDLGEAVEDGVTGFLVAPDDPAALSAAMLRLLTDPALAARLGEAGRRRVAGAWDTAAGIVATTLSRSELEARR